jgi:hypothetical protein
MLPLWCNCATSRACCLIVLSIRLRQSPGALADSEISLLSLFPFLFRSHCSLAAMKVTRIVFLDTSPAMPLASPASAIFISLSIGNFPIVPPIGLPPSWVAIVAGSLVVASRRVASIACAFCSCRARPPPIVQRCWKCRFGVNSMLKIECQCPLVARCRDC